MPKSKRRPISLRRTTKGIRFPGLSSDNSALSGEQQVYAIQECLDYLAAEASKSKMPFLAHLIGVAADCARELAHHSNLAPEDLVTSKAANRRPL